MRSSRRSGRLASVRPGAGSTSRQRRSGERDASASQCPSGSAASASPKVGRGSPPSWSAPTSAATSPSNSTAAVSSSSCRSKGDSRQQTREPVDRRLEVVRFPCLAHRRRRAEPVGLEQRADVLELGDERRVLALGDRGHAGTATDCEGSNTGGSAERSTSRLSTPSTVSRTHCEPGGTSPSANVSVEVAVVRSSASALSPPTVAAPPAPVAPAAADRASP